MKNKIIKGFVLLTIIFFTFCNTALGFKSFENQDTTEKVSSIWAIQVGYFPEYTNSFTSDGVSLLILNELIIAKEINYGYYFTLLKAFNNKLNTNNPNGSFSIGTYLNYPLDLNNNNHLLIIRVGLGLGYPTAALNFLNIIMFEYTMPLNNNVAFSFSIIQEIVRFNFILPVQINFGIRF